MYCVKEKYDLPDLQIIDSPRDFDFFLWQPGRLYIVLGRSDKIDSAVNLKEADKENACIVKRPSGGHSVVLSPRTVVISAIVRRCGIRGADVFAMINKIIIRALEDLGVKDAGEKGISDLAIGEKKILGSSIYRPRHGNYFYHAVLNHSEDIYLIGKLLLHPKREPGYRQGRPHWQFVTSLAKEGYSFTIAELLCTLRSRFEEFVARGFNY